VPRDHDELAEVNGVAAPLFATFGARLADSIRKMLADDIAAEKLTENKKSLSAISQADDQAIVNRHSPDDIQIRVSPYDSATHLSRASVYRALGA
jgi:uncharacterized protein YbaA (DUF1428 family)